MGAEFAVYVDDCGSFVLLHRFALRSEGEAFMTGYVEAAVTLAESDWYHLALTDGDGIVIDERMHGIGEVSFLGKRLP